ncbi:CaiB/BaiF CoA transferase family protein [Pseudorhodoplanes sinuspersici]|nr:CoA transferase [Pseudorhodoplanes sinuspersici]RKE73480.1 crotonobetainyl-CoA:carnitine CoA-transferase CaiB-like acyl-CoA transferase [Pseudorhodoplanes sinuspersici]
MQPLSGIKVLDLTNLLPGPLATLMLAEAGAEVLKIERPGGDDMRGYQPEWNGTGAAFGLLNRGKKSFILDLKSEKGADRLRLLLQDVDVLVEQFRPGIMDKLGFGYAAVREVNPHLIYCSITGYGQSGHRAQEAGHDLNYIGHTGLLALQPGPTDRPVVPPALIADIGGGTFPAVINILLALRQRDLTGQGCHLDIAMTDAMFTFAWHALARRFATERCPAPGESELCGGSPRYQLYPAKDGGLIACAALEDHFWRRFASVIGLDPTLTDDRRDPAATMAAVAALIATRSAAEWEPVFAKADCCLTIVRSLDDALSDPHFIQRGLFSRRLRGLDGGTMPALPLPIAPQFRGPADDEKPVPPLSQAETGW